MISDLPLLKSFILSIYYNTDGENTLSLLQASLNSQEQFFLGDLFVLVYIHNVHDFLGVSQCNALPLAYLRKYILDDPQKLS